jgi:hypothetical protein
MLPRLSSTLAKQRHLRPWRFSACGCTPSATHMSSINVSLVGFIHRNMRVLFTGQNVEAKSAGNDLTFTFSKKLALIT